MLVQNQPQTDTSGANLAALMLLRLSVSLFYPLYHHFLVPPPSPNASVNDVTLSEVWLGGGGGGQAL